MITLICALMDLHQEVVIVMRNFGLTNLMIAMIVVIQRSVKILIIPTVVIVPLEIAKVVLYHLIVHKIDLLQKKSVKE